MNNRLDSTQKTSAMSKNGNQAKGPKKKRGLAIPILLILVGCAVFLFAAWSAVRSPVLASIINSTYSPQVQQQEPGQSYAQAYVPKPTYTPSAGQPVAQQDSQPVVVQPTATFTQEPQVVLVPPTDSPAVVVQPTDAPTEVASSESVTVAQAEIIPDTPTPEYVAPTEQAYVPPSGLGTGGEHWFDVDLSDQRMYAYEGDTLVRTFIVSTGTWQTPTVTGRFKVWIKLRSAPMSGPGYYLPDVPYIMYFYGDYGIHGTYWHNNFGVPMSHGCVNLSISDAEWAYNFASVGTVVNVHD